MSVKDIASCTGISESSVQTILKKRLDPRKICARWVPHLLTEEQKTQCLKCARELLKTERFALGGYLICSLRSKGHNALNVPGNFRKHTKAVIVGLFLTY